MVKSHNGGNIIEGLPTNGTSSFNASPFLRKISLGTLLKSTLGGLGTESKGSKSCRLDDTDADDDDGVGVGDSADSINADNNNHIGGSEVSGVGDHF